MTLTAAAAARPARSESRERHRQRRLEEGADPEDAAAGWQGTEAEATELMVYHAAILRNKRLLFTYMWVYQAGGGPSCWPVGGRR